MSCIQIWRKTQLWFRFADTRYDRGYLRVWSFVI